MSSAPLLIVYGEPVRKWFKETFDIDAAEYSDSPDTYQMIDGVEIGGLEVRVMKTLQSDSS